jgi:competence ComEA-like helix-hairpin-helix protein
MLPEKPLESASPRWLLRRLDQLAVAGLCLFALVALAIYWLAHGGLSGRLIEIDRVDPLTVQFQVDVNTADLPELINIPEIGNALAQRILDYRQQNGSFKSVDELRHIKGIGSKTLEKIKPYIRPLNPPGVDVK